MSFLRNTWYVASWADELTDEMLPRTILNEPIVMYRDETGKAVAISNRCPHRFAPLHMGKLKNGIIQCGYHGLSFDSSGHCVHNPHGDGRIPQAARVKSYPLVERYNLLWIWAGEAAKADAGLTPEFDQLVDPKYKTIKGYKNIQAHYELVADNLMDLSHVQYLHAEYHSMDTLLTMPHEVLQEGTTVYSKRRMPAVKGPNSFMKNFDDPDILIDFRMIVRWDPPGVYSLDNGVTPAGRPESEGLCRRGTHFVTPETDSSTHYFFGNARNYRINDPIADEHIREWQRIGFSEQDTPMLEAVQKLMGTTDLLSLKPILLPADAPAIRARRILADLIAKESQERQQSAA